jgi:hypothetical protein
VRKEFLQKARQAAIHIPITILLLEGIGLIFWSITEHGLFYLRPYSWVEYSERPVTNVSFNLQWGYSGVPGVSLENTTPRSTLDQLLGPHAHPAFLKMTNNNFGFMSNYEYPTEKNPKTFIVGVFGGSVAYWLSIMSHAKLEEVLRKGLGPQREIRILNFAIKGGKQPQQLMISGFFHSMGQRFDAVVNLDGFNEVYYAKRQQAKQWPYYTPAVDIVGGLMHIADERSELVSSADLWEVMHLSQRIKSVERKMAETPSAFIFMALSAYRHYMTHAFNSENEKLAHRNGENSTSAYHLVDIGPHIAPAPGTDVFEAVADLWARSSVATRALVEGGFGEIFIQAIQPNRHFHSSELASGIANHESLAHEAASLGYPKLLAKKAFLTAAGVDVLDLTDVFVDEDMKSVVFADGCCHFNQIGNDRLAVRLGNEILRRFSRLRLSKTP